jgi:hypothetical protein
MAYTLAYHETALVTAVKRFIVQAPCVSVRLQSKWHKLQVAIYKLQVLQVTYRCLFAEKLYRIDPKKNRIPVRMESGGKSTFWAQSNNVFLQVMPAIS